MPKQRTYLRALLMHRFNWLEERVIRNAKRYGYHDVTPAMSRLFGFMGGRPIGLSELSRRMGVSRQAVHKLANDAARLGLVEFVAAPDDARVVRLQFTQAGWEMSAQAARSLDEIEAEIRSRLGARHLAELKRLLELPWDASEAGSEEEQESGPPG